MLLPIMNSIEVVHLLILRYICREQKIAEMH